MTTPVYASIQQVVEDPLFPELDMALRQGRHIEPDDVALHSFATAAQPILAQFFDRYGCDLVFTKEQVIYLLPRGDSWGRRRLTRVEMLVGQALALLYLDPSTTTSSGRVRASSPLDVLVSLLGKEAVAAALVGRRTGKRTETYDAEQAQREVHKALRTLARLGFVRMEDEEQVRLGPALGRFIEPVQRASDPKAAMATLISKGMVERDDDEPAG